MPAAEHERHRQVMRTHKRGRTRTRIAEEVALSSTEVSKTIARYKEMGLAVLAFAMARQVAYARWADVRDALAVAPVLVDESRLDDKDEEWDDEDQAPQPAPIAGLDPHRFLSSPLLLDGVEQRPRAWRANFTICWRRCTAASGQTRTCTRSR